MTRDYTAREERGCVRMSTGSSRHWGSPGISGAPVY
jgi:hypothetical protein